jgi:uncharacterized protein involved in exopolysaccharide biosynthesis
MNDAINLYEHRPSSFTTRDVAAIGFRHKRVMMLSFLGVFVGVTLSWLVLPSKYRSETKLLVKRERVDPVITPDKAAQMTFRDTVSEEEINSEVELITSQDVLQQVVTSCRLDRKGFLSSMVHPFATEQNRIDHAVADLRSDLELEVLKKTNVISIAYESRSPRRAQRVLAALDSAYLEKHLDVHHPAGQFQFFDQQAEQYKKDLLSAEEQLKQFADQQGGVAPSTMRDITLQKLADFNGQLQTTRASIRETQTRISDLEKQSSSTPSRLTTQMKNSDNPQVLENLKATLISLENKRTELLTKYQPTYPLVEEVDKELADTRGALAKEESSPVKEETTDQNPTYAWVSGELAKAKADLSGFHARETALLSSISFYNEQVRKLEQQGIQQGDLVRTEKANEANYLLYTQKKEEARIEDALDRTRLLNVSVVETPALPSLPTRSPLLLGLVALLLASAVSIGVVVAMDYADQSFRTPSEVLEELRIPVLAAVPAHQSPVLEAYSDPGTGNGNGNRHRTDDIHFDPNASGTMVPEQG